MKIDRFLQPDTDTWFTHSSDFLETLTFSADFLDIQENCGYT